MTVSQTLHACPDDLVVVMQSNGSSATYTDTAAGWLHAYTDEYIDEWFTLVTPVTIPGQDVQDDTGSPYVDIVKLVSGEFDDREWLCEPILPKGKLVGLVSKRGMGKSLLALDLSCRLAAGHPFLDQPAGTPVDVLYLDYEMGYEDLQERLYDLGWTLDNPDLPTLAGHLHYAQLPDLPPLDTEPGGEALISLVNTTNARLVVVDTVSRVVSGDENSAEPYRDLFRHTERWIRGQGATILRLDHLGKDPDKGSRGSSAKEDPLDVVWHLEESAVGTLVLTLTKNRPGWMPLHVTIHREDNDGEISHTRPVEHLSDAARKIVDEMDDLKMPYDISRRKAQQEFDEQTGRKRKNNVLAEAVRFRKGRGRHWYSTESQKGVPNASTTPNVPVQDGYQSVPPIGGYNSGNTPELDLENDEYDPEDLL